MIACLSCRRKIKYRYYSGKYQPSRLVEGLLSIYVCIIWLFVLGLIGENAVPFIHKQTEPQRKKTLKRRSLGILEKASREFDDGSSGEVRSAGATFSFLSLVQLKTLLSSNHYFLLYIF